MSNRIDAEKIAKQATERLAKVEKDGYENYGERLLSKHNQRIVESIIAKVITDNIDLKIKWVDGKAEYGIFSLFCWMHGNEEWHWDITTGEGGYILAEEEDAKSKELAQQACETALRKIICGIKE